MANGEAQNAKASSGLDKVLAGLGDLIFRGVLIMVYGKKLGETKGEKAGRWAVAGLVLIIVVAGVMLLTRGGSGKRGQITKRSSRSPARTSTGPSSYGGAPRRGPEAAPRGYDR